MATTAMLTNHIVHCRSILQKFCVCSKKAAVRRFTDNHKEHVVKVAVIGDPNVGKSTLVNSLLGRRVTSVSSKVHTTRRKTLAVLNVDNTQLVFVDTPGFVSEKSRIRHGVEKSLIVDAYASIEEVDVVVALHDASNFYRRYQFSMEIEKALKLIPTNVCSVLVLNKVDLVTDKPELLVITNKLTKPPEPEHSRKRKSLQDMFDVHDQRRATVGNGSNSSTLVAVEQSNKEQKFQYGFDGVFMVSAKDGTGVQGLRDYLLKRAVESPWLYDRGFVTDQSLEEMVSMCVKEKILDVLSEEIPYVVRPVVDLIHEDESGLVNILVSLRGDSKRILSSLMGPKGNTIREVAIAAEQSLTEALDKPVVLKVILKQPQKATKKWWER